MTKTFRFHFMTVQRAAKVNAKLNINVIVCHGMYKCSCVQINGLHRCWNECGWIRPTRPKMVESFTSCKLIWFIIKRNIIIQLKNVVSHTSTTLLEFHKCLTCVGLLQLFQDLLASSLYLMHMYKCQRDRDFLLKRTTLPLIRSSSYGGKKCALKGA